MRSESGMMSSAPEIKGWCPGALRPMASGDGLLIRAKIVGSRLLAHQAREIARIASRYGNGLLDLSQRAQLQLRGVSDATLDDALRRLAALSLLAPDAATESVLNMIASPLAGLDPQAPFDANDLAARLAQVIGVDKTLRALPGKFFFAIDDTSALGLADVAADIRIEALREPGAARLAVTVAGAPDEAVVVEESAVVETALELARAFVNLRKGREFELRRMRSLVQTFGLAPLLREAGLDATPCQSQRRLAHPRDIFGAQAIGALCFAGVAAPFGRWRARDLTAMAELASREGSGELRLTPWRALLAPAPSLEAARRIVEAAAAQGLIVAHNDPRLCVVACPGAPECPQAQGATRAHLDRLAPLAQRLARGEGVALHVSGCAKGCARPGPAQITLLARGDCFDLIENGRASDAPHLTSLTLADVERKLAARAAQLGETSPCPAH
jgi:precorrin-3B synthase